VNSSGAGFGGFKLRKEFLWPSTADSVVELRRLVKEKRIIQLLKKWLFVIKKKVIFGGKKDRSCIIWIWTLHLAFGRYILR